MLESLKTKIPICLLGLLILIINFALNANANDCENMYKKYDDDIRAFSKAGCPQITISSDNQCRCAQMTDYFTLYCKSSAIKIELNAYVNVFCCNPYVSLSKEILPKASMGFVKKVDFQPCSLQRNESVKDIIDHLGIQGFNVFGFRTREMTAHKHQLSRLENVIEMEYDLTSSNILPNNLFEGVPNIQKLVFHTNQNLLPKGLFDPMSNLNKLLIMGKSDFIELEADIFQNVKNLGVLHITNNAQLILPKDVFKNTTNLKLIRLADNYMISLPEGIFNDSKELKEVIFIGYSFTSLRNGIFRFTTKLEKIVFKELSGERRTLPEEFLTNLKSLEKVRLSTGLEELPDNSFKGSSNIKDMNLSENRLHKLSSNLLRDQINLEKLDLSKNLLTTLPDDIFLHMIHLKELLLSNNKLITITNSLSSLDTLRLDNTNLSFIENNIENNNSLPESDLSNNRLHINSTRPLFDSLHPFGNLQILDLAYNNITIITYEDLLFSTRRLQMDLSYNQIETVDFSRMDFSRDPNISLSLQGNPIKCDCKIIHFLKYVKNTCSKFDLQCEKPTEFEGRSLMAIDPCDLTCPRTEPEVCPEPCQCEERACDNAFIINCSNAKLVHFPKLPQYDFIRPEKILLEMQNNKLKDLPVESSESYDKIFSLDLRDNSLEEIQISYLPASLEILDLRRNSLTNLPYHIFESWSTNSSNSKAIYLSQNPWICSCNLLQFVQNNYNKVVDRDVLQCLNDSNQYQFLTSYNSIHLCSKESQLVIAAVIGFCGLMFGLLIAIYCIYKNEIKIWLYSHNLCLWFVSVEDLEKDKIYDGFISYSHKDKEFVQQKLLPFLEHGPLSFKICDHERDWLVGDTIPQQIIESVENSRRTLIVLSDDYLDSVWGRMEFQVAHQLCVKEKQSRLIIILYKKLENTEKLDAELKAYMNMNTYLEWGNPWFWKKLLYAMPHSKYSKSVKELNDANEDDIQTENELEMRAI